MGLNVDMHVGETLSFSVGGISITLLYKSGQRALLQVEADASVAINPPGRNKQQPFDPLSDKAGEKNAGWGGINQAACS